MDRIGLPLPWGIVPAERLFQVVTGNDPAAGAEVSVTVPGGVVWQVMSLAVSFVTSAVVANRRPTLVLDDGAFTFKARAMSSTIPAGQTIGLVFAPAGDSNDALAFAAGTLLAFDWPPLLAGHRIRTITTALDAGDNYGAPVLYVAEYEMRGLGRGVAKYLEALARAGAEG